MASPSGPAVSTVNLTGLRLPRRAICTIRAAPGSGSPDGLTISSGSWTGVPGVYQRTLARWVAVATGGSPDTCLNPQDQVRPLIATSALPGVGQANSCLPAASCNGARAV